MNRRISVIIPNYNSASTIGKCIETAFSSRYENFEIVVVDDCSTDNSADIIGKFPCRFIRLDRHYGASRARNTGAENSSGEILFFIDADCILQENTLELVNKAFDRAEDIITGGTYTLLPYNNDFFSTFQSIFINYFETKCDEPDYIATHAMAVAPDIFKKAGGFSEDFLPILEDIEFSHRLKKLGYRLKTIPEISVQHIFNFTLIKSLKNAFRKSMYWTIYSLKNKDLLADSGTASAELKINVVSYFFIVFFLLLYAFLKINILLIAILPVITFNLYINRRLLTAFYKAKGLAFGLSAALYYTMLYPLSVGTGSLYGIVRYLYNFK
ncbi:MAG: glycosyltransferase [Nitrospirae bacterium]|nr:glycosyltransferase [Nitrospirota bacterium]